TAGNVFVVPEAELVANTRKGKHIMNVGLPEETQLLVPVSGDHVAFVGENRKLLVFPLSQVPEMSRGKGVRQPANLPMRGKPFGTVRPAVARS
ncbi:DNA gyrase C-terminal beta-propeller domain-containing protein, partial [Rhizobium johnstonii]|uniref:DNA gyrase C-terminal beta-propeller domain-containing protein n=1 Tax=Rhizobium johnstonii TaxID=3019933 RepID=UPI003F9EAD58